MAELRERLQAALGEAYRVERELGGGGMSRVFVAQDTALGRRVVVKVLPPEMGAGVSVDRFEREIQLAANLQHPHIVPLLTAGSSDDLLYYIMPYIEGESLRAKLAREGELPVPEALRILRDVLDALAYAHRHHVVHRDIKPDNVMLSEGHALVTDFGVAKAVAESTGKQTLTSMGVALGTPLYMAPEQATADPHTDHRADIYAVGVLAYEMLCGRPPFTGVTPQAVLAAHMADAPEPVTKHRGAVPDALNQVILRCLEKKAADRWQRVDELLPHIEAILTQTGGTTPTGTQPVISSGTQAAIDRAHPVRVAGLFGLGAAVVLTLVYLIMIQLGLPDWVFLGAVALLAVGLPIMLVTAHHEKQRALERSTGARVPAPPSGLRRWLTWRKALLGGAFAFAGLGVFSGAYMAMRLLGIGPAGTLVASGRLAERDLLVVADFQNRTGDSSLAASVTEALRIDLRQSPVVKIMDAAAIGRALQRMNRQAGALLLDVAREIAEREGAKAVVTGDIGTLGQGFVLSARLVSARDGSELVALRETAADDRAIIGAVDRLSKKMRERIGESLKSIRKTEPLEQVTTASIAALRRYTQASRLFDRGKYGESIPLLEDAIRLDSTFAMAYRRLAVAFFNIRGPRSGEIQAAREAFRYRQRLPPVERYLADGWYFDRVEADRAKATASYQSALDIDPANVVALVNLAMRYNQTRRYQLAEDLALRAMAVGDQVPSYAQAFYAQVSQGKFAAAETTLARLARRLPEARQVWTTRARFAATKGDFATAALTYDSLLRMEQGLNWRALAYDGLADVALARGRLADAERYRREAMAANEAWGVPAAYFKGALRLASGDLRQRGDTARALRTVEAALTRQPLSTIPPADRPYLRLAELYAGAGRVDLARRTMAEYENEVDGVLRRGDPGRYGVAGAVARAEGRLADAIGALRRFSEEATGPFPGLVSLAETYDRLGNADSALVYYERFVAADERFAATLVVIWELGADGALPLGPSYKRLGELHEQRGDRQKALDYYGRFVDLWKDADPELQPLVKDVRARLARLAREH